MLPVNVAVTDRAWSIVTTHVDALPVQEPDHDESDCPDPGVAVNVTSAPLPYTSEHDVLPLPQ